MAPPDKIPFAVLRSIVRHARDRAISTICGSASGLRAAMRERAQHDDEGKRRYGMVPWNGVAWKQTDDVARSINLRWSGDHYGFTFAGMYVGIELDGYMHT